MLVRWRSVGDIIIGCNVKLVHTELAPDKSGCYRAYKSKDKDIISVAWPREGDVILAYWLRLMRVGQI